MMVISVDQDANNPLNAPSSSYLVQSFAKKRPRGSSNFTATEDERATAVLLYVILSCGQNVETNGPLLYSYF
jgi:hypothetical protein